MGGPYDEKLDLPGGTIEFNETPVDALKRKIYEETGVKINNNVLIDNKNDDSSGANFYNIYDLKREELSSIAILEIEKLGYKLN